MNSALEFPSILTFAGRVGAFARPLALASIIVMYGEQSLMCMP
jgi:hypothetical protein